MTDTPTTAAPTDIGPATASMLPNLSPDAARAEINALKAGADLDFSRAYLDGGHMGHEAALQRMTRLHELAAGVTADPAAPASTTPGRDAATGRFASESDQVDATPYAGLRLETLPADAPIEDLARTTTDVQFMAASTGVHPDLAKSGVQMIERDIAARQGRAMDAGELAAFESALFKRVGEEGYGKACEALQRAIKRAGPRGEAMRRSILSASPETAAWVVSTMHFEGR
jgi:hypothetical protein